MLDPQTAYKLLLDAAEKGETDRLVQEDFFARIAHLTLDGEPLIEKQDPHDHYTPLICAAKLNHSKCVALLCTVGKANINNKAGWNETTALMKAAEKGHDEVIQVLLELGADINLRNSFGNTALMLACVKGHWDVVKCLTRPQYGTDIHVENNDKSDTALTMACLGGRAHIVKHLVDLGANVHYRNANKETVLMKACEKGDEESMNYLLSHFTDAEDILLSLTAQNKHGNTCLMR